MPTHAEEKFLQYEPEQLFKLVADVERYPEFLPWCTGVRVIRNDGDVILADLMVSGSCAMLPMTRFRLSCI